MGSLTTYYLLMVRFQMKQKQLKRYEWCFHILPVTWGVSTGIATIPLKISNNANLWCFIAPSDDPNRGHRADFYRMLFFYGPLYFMFFVVTVNVIIIVSYVHRVTAKADLVSARRLDNRPHDFQSGNNLECEDYGDEEDGEEKEDSCSFSSCTEKVPVSSEAVQDIPVTEIKDAPTDEGKGQAKSLGSSNDVSLSSSGRKTMTKSRYAHWRRQVSRQSFGFALAFYWTWIPISVSVECTLHSFLKTARRSLLLTISHLYCLLDTQAVRMLQLGKHPVPFWLLVVSTITTPMQGLPVLLVHCYPKYQKFLKHRKANSKVTIMHWIRAGMATSVAHSGDEEQNPTNDREHRRRSRSADILNPNYDGVLAERGPHMRGIPSSSIPSEPAHGLPPIQEIGSAWDEESVPHEISDMPYLNPVSQSAEFDTEKNEFTRKVSFQDKEFANFASESATSVPKSILRNGENSNISQLSDHNVSMNELLDEEDKGEKIPERGDVSRWNPLAIFPKSDRAPDSPRRLQAESPSINSPKFDSPPAKPRRLASNISNDE
jgi:hypothetical protein